MLRKNFTWSFQRAIQRLAGLLYVWNQPSWEYEASLVVLLLCRLFLLAPAAIAYIGIWQRKPYYLLPFVVSQVRVLIKAWKKVYRSQDYHSTIVESKNGLSASGVPELGRSKQVFRVFISYTPQSIFFHVLLLHSSLLINLECPFLKKQYSNKKNLMCLGNV